MRLKDNPDCGKRIAAARGTHLIFKKGFLPDHSGIIIPKTEDGRLIFIISYLGHSMVGTTDEKCEITHFVNPPKEDIDFIVKEMKKIFGEGFDYHSNL